MTLSKRFAMMALSVIMALTMAVPSLGFVQLASADEVAAQADPTAFTIAVKTGTGAERVMQEYTAADLTKLAEQNTTGIGVQHVKNGVVVTAAAAGEYVKMSQLFADATVDDNWKAGSSLQVWCGDEGMYAPGGKWTDTSYENVANMTSFFPSQSNSDLNNAAGAVEVPFSLMLKTRSASDSTSMTAGDLLTDALAATPTDGLKIASGGWVDSGTNEIMAPGWRLATGPTKIVVVDPNATDVKDLKVTCNSSAHFNGMPQTPPVEVKDGNYKLVEGTDYDIVYSNNTNVGKASYTITGKGSFSGSYTGSFEITDTALTIAVKSGDSAERTVKEYTNAQLLEMAKANTTTLGVQHVKGGSVVVTAAGAGEYVTMNQLFTDAAVTGNWKAGSSLQVWCGDEGMYAPGGKWSDTSYEAVSNMKYFYPNQSATDVNNAAGAQEVPFSLMLKTHSASDTASMASDILIDAMNNAASEGYKIASGGWVDSTSNEIMAPGWRLATGPTKIVIVDPTDINGAKLKADASVKYTGNPLTCNISLSDGDKNLVENVDYTVAYTDNTNVGTASYVITGIGTYSGTIKGTFEITDKILKVYTSVDGADKKLVKEYTADDLAKLVATETYGTQFVKGNSVVVRGTNKLVTLDALLKDANASSFWNYGSNLEFTCSDGPYAKCKPSYSDIKMSSKFFGAQSNSDLSNTTGATDVPAGFMLATASVTTTGETATDALAAFTDADFKANDFAGFFMGAEAKADGSISAPGFRLAGGVTEVTVNAIPKNPFTDVSDAALQGWANPFLDYVSNAGIMKGYSDNATSSTLTYKFGPYDSTLRADLTVMLYRIACAKDATLEATYGSTSDSAKFAATNTTGLTDVQGGQYYTAAANWAVDKGVMKGYDGTKNFGPFDPVLRAHAAKVIAESVKAINGNDITKFDKQAYDACKDTADVPADMVDYMAWCADNGVITGVVEADGNHLDPMEPVWRASSAKIMTVSICDVMHKPLA